MKESSDKQLAHIAEEPEFSQVQLHYIIDTAVQQFWASAESQASRVGILQTVLDEVAISMKEAFTCEEGAGNQMIFSKTQVKYVLAIVSEECGKALKLALDNVWFSCVHTYIWQCNRLRERCQPECIIRFGTCPRVSFSALSVMLLTVMFHAIVRNSLHH